MDSIDRFNAAGKAHQDAVVSMVEALADLVNSKRAHDEAMLAVQAERDKAVAESAKVHDSLSEYLEQQTLAIQDQLRAYHESKS